MASKGDLELFQPTDGGLIEIENKSEEGMTSFRRKAEELMLDMSKWTEVTPFISKKGHKHYRNVNQNGGVAYLSIGTVKVSAKLACELNFKMLSTPEMMDNGLPKGFNAKTKLLEEIDENTVITERVLKSPGGPAHSAWLVMNDPTGGCGLNFMYSITKAPDGVEIMPLKTVNGYKQAYGMVGYRFSPIKGRENEPVCEFRLLHQWWENKGPTDNVEDSKVIDSKAPPPFVAELIFRSNIKTIHRLAGLKN
jgi:hypothetical protein